MKCPCTKDCARRNGYICRRTCVEFIEYEKDLTEKRNAKRINNQLDDFKIENALKARKKKWRRKR